MHPVPRAPTGRLRIPAVVLAAMVFLAAPVAAQRARPVRPAPRTTVAAPAAPARGPHPLRPRDPRQRASRRLPSERGTIF